MAYMTDMADWAGSFMEGIDSLMVSSTPGIMLVLGIVTIISSMTIFFMWIKKQANGGV